MNLRHRDRSRGQALVEFAIVFPIFALLLFGLIDVGRMVYVYNAISQGAREGARFGSVADFSSNCNLGRDACIVREVTRRMAAVPTSAVDVTCRRETGSGTVVIANADTCRGTDLLIVNVTTPVEMLTPGIDRIVGTITLRSEARVVVNS
jgi:Flp pilus assembly protein TadG